MCLADTNAVFVLQVTLIVSKVVYIQMRIKNTSVMICITTTAISNPLADPDNRIYEVSVWMSLKYL